MTHSALRYTTMQSNTRYLMFNIGQVEFLVVLAFRPFNIIINDLNVFIYNYVTTPPTNIVLYFQKNKILDPIVIVIFASVIVLFLLFSLCFLCLAWGI